MIYTIVPLGNPGKEYENTRHNSARVVTSNILDDIKNLEGCEMFIPKTFMNESGRGIAEYLKFHEGRELVVIHDDKDIAIGKIRISYDRGDGGHNGVKNIIESLGTKDFIRIRIGIAPIKEDGIVEAPHGDVVQKYVLGRLSDEEIISLRAVSTTVLSALKIIAEEGYQKAMDRFN